MTATSVSFNYLSHNDLLHRVQNGTLRIVKPPDAEAEFGIEMPHRLLVPLSIDCCVTITGSGDWLDAMQISIVGLKMKNSSVRIALCHRLGAHIVDMGMPCMTAP